MKILVLDGNNRAALAITRSLGKRGHKIYVGEKTSTSLAGSSRYCESSFMYPNPGNNSNILPAPAVMRRPRYHSMERGPPKKCQDPGFHQPAGQTAEKRSAPPKRSLPPWNSTDMLKVHSVFYTFSRRNVFIFVHFKLSTLYKFLRLQQH